MRTTAVIVLAGLCALALATPVKQSSQEYEVADKVFLQKQKDVLTLFNFVSQPRYHPELVEIANEFKFEGHWDQWTQPQFAKDFWHYYQHDILPQGEVFSVFYPEHLEQAIALFKVFYYAKDYETFYKTAVWARNHVNEGMYVYALSVAIHHSKHTDGLVLPPIYEIYPHFFFNDETLYKAKQYKQHYWGKYEHENEITDKDFKGYTIHANYSGWYLNVHPEQSMTYFTEDVGMNSYYYYYSIYAPFWMESEHMQHPHEHRGEHYYYFHQQLLARYYLERLSNNFGEIPHFEYEFPIETGYYPSMQYTNGLHFPSRPNHAHLYYQSVHGQQSYESHGNYTWSYTSVKDYERRLRDAVDMGYVYTPEGKMVKLFEKEGFETLGNLVESNADSVNGRFYGDLQIFARHLLGFSLHPLDEYKIAPSALEHFETSLRDPMFWQMYKRIMSYFHQHQNYEGAYEKKDLLFDGVKIEDFTVDRLVTYFDYFYSDISNAVVDEKAFLAHDFEIRARQHRLNHKPFNYKVNVVSDKATEAFVKVFIGPKYDEFGREIDMDVNRVNFFELDRFQYTLTAGKNVIERNSFESKYFSNDRTTYKQLYKNVMNAFNGGEAFKVYTAKSSYYGIPHRYMLPKGSIGGQTYQFYVIVTPFHQPTKDTVFMQYMIDETYALGYPFDKPIKFEHDFYVPNSYFKDVVIYHKNIEEDINTIWSNQ